MTAPHLNGPRRFRRRAGAAEPSRLARRRNGTGPERFGEHGYSLVELSIALLLFSLLIGMVIPIVNTLFRTTAYVSNSYANENQLLPISTTFQNLIRSVVSPAPSLGSGQPVPAYGIYRTSGTATTGLSSSSMTFFTNIGDPNGPAEVSATLVSSVFTINVARATGNCPGLTGGTQCTWGSPRPLVRVTNVVNTSSTPIFVYSVGGTSYSDITTPTAAAEFGTCTASACPAANIGSVKVDLEVNVSPTQGGQAQEETVVYQLSALSQTYQPEVG